MANITDHHPICHSCGDENDELTRYKWCLSCRLAERRKKLRLRNGDGVKKQKTNACGLHYIGMVNAAAPTDALPDGLKGRPGRSGRGWVELC